VEQDPEQGHGPITQGAAPNHATHTPATAAAGVWPRITFLGWERGLQGWPNSITVGDQGNMGFEADEADGGDGPAPPSQASTI
jgi:hypothetical protein